MSANSLKMQIYITSFQPLEESFVPVRVRVAKRRRLFNNLNEKMSKTVKSIKQYVCVCIFM